LATVGYDIGRREVDLREEPRPRSRKSGPGRGAFWYDAGVLNLRSPGESDDEFRTRAERAGRIAKLLVDSSLGNRCVQEYLADPALPDWTVESVRVSPTVRVEYEQAIAIGDIGSCLSATASKRWGNGPWVMPLEPDDEFFADRVTYIYRANSLYNRRFEQRRRLKELLGKRLRPLVETAKRRTKTLFLDLLTREEADAIRRILNMEPGAFWRACKVAVCSDRRSRGQSWGPRSSLLGFRASSAISIAASGSGPASRWSVPTTITADSGRISNQASRNQGSS